MQCAICNLAGTIGFCDTCKSGVCDGCSTECKKCGKRVCRKHFQVTPHGRKLCGDCWGRREEKVAARKGEKAARAAADRPEDMSFEALSSDSGVPGKALGIQETSVRTRGTPAATPENRPEVPRMHSVLMRKKAEETADEDFEDRADSDEPAVLGPTSAEVLEGGMTFEEMRSKIEGMDPNRPIQARSGYKPPSRTAYALAFLAFTVVGYFLWIRVPVIREVMWPFDVGGIEFDEHQEAFIADTNRLRNSSNITNLNLLVVVPLFVFAWGLFLTYVFGTGVIIWGTTQSLTHYFKRRRDDKIRQAAVGDKSYPY